MNLSEAFTQIGQWFAAHALRLLPAAGTAGQVLRKVDGTDYNVEWGTPDAGGAQTIQAKALVDIPAGTLVRLTVELGDPATVARTNAPDPGGRTVGVGVLADDATAGNPVTVRLGVIYTDPAGGFYAGYPVYMRADNTLTVSPVGTTPGIGVAQSETEVLLTNDVQRAGTIDFNAYNPDGTLTPAPEAAIYLSHADGTNALRRTGPGSYQLTRAAELVTTAGTNAGGYGIPMYSDTAVVLWDSAESTVIDASGFTANKPILFVQLGAGQVKIDGFNTKCKGLPITETANGAITLTPTQYGANVVTGDLAAADTATYYTGLHENSTSSFPFFGGIVDSGGFQVAAGSTSILSARTRDTIPISRTYVEFSVLLNGGGTFGFAKGFYFGGELGLDANSIALRVTADLADLELRHNGAVLATIAGAGSLASSPTRFGVLVDRATGELWIRAASGWLGPDPATDPGLPYFPGGDGGTAWFAVEGRPNGGDQRLFFMPSSMSWTAEATAAGAVQIGMIAP
ncbi:hypothetical protein ACI2IY_05625 [Lysobacter enzymogenes]|uniref:hypothetical protein n=1 Tax=Lysobacter enzymogenes TaxID=69 RepID=UPI00384B8D78